MVLNQDYIAFFPPFYCSITVKKFMGKSMYWAAKGRLREAVSHTKSCRKLNSCLTWSTQILTCLKSSVPHFSEVALRLLCLGTKASHGQLHEHSWCIISLNMSTEKAEHWKTWRIFALHTSELPFELCPSCTNFKNLNFLNKAWMKSKKTVLFGFLIASVWTWTLTSLSLTSHLSFSIPTLAALFQMHSCFELGFLFVHWFW